MKYFEGFDVSRKQIKSHLQKHRRKLRDKTETIERARVPYAQEDVCSLSDMSQESGDLLDPRTHQAAEIASSTVHTFFDPAVRELVTAQPLSSHRFDLAHALPSDLLHPHQLSDKLSHE